jgi:hypothetical protein
MLAAVASVVCALGMVTACGGGKSTDAADASAASATGSAEDYTLKFNQCLRDAGFNVSDSDEGKDIRTQDVGGDAAAFNTAVEDCEKKLGPPPGASTQNPDDPEILQSSIALAECLRNEGYDVKDPEPGKGLSIDVGTIPQEAIEKCAASAAPSSASEGDQ